MTVLALPGPAPALPDVQAVRAQGAWVEGADGRRYLDLTSGVATLNVGHGHPRVLAAARAQLERVVHSGGVLSHPETARLAERLAEIAPPNVDAFLFATTGSEAIELALGLARRATGRRGVVAFRGGFHGRTQGALAATSSRAAFRTDLQADGVRVAPFPRPGEWGLDPEAAADLALRGLDEVHRHELAPAETACYLVEPIQGQGGCHPAGRRFLQGLRERADRYGALLVFDEIQTGFGRTGEWFAAQTYGVAPDVLVMAKALGAGFPLSAVGARQALLAALPPGRHGGTFGGAPLACAAGLAAIEAIVAEGLLDRARTLGGRAAADFERLAAGVPELAEVRGLGLMLGLEFADPADRRPRPDLAQLAVERAREQRVIVIRSGPEGNVIRFLPPLTLSDAELTLGLEVLGRSIEAARSAIRPAFGALARAA